MTVTIGGTATPWTVARRLRALGYVVELAVLLVVVRVRLARHGFKPAVEWCTALPGPRRELEDAGCREAVELARDMAEHVFRWHPVANKCLEQSMLVCRFLARRGITAELIIAVRKYPFESHAWARWADLDLTPPPERDAEDFRELARFPVHQ